MKAPYSVQRVEIQFLFSTYNPYIGSQSSDTRIIELARFGIFDQPHLRSEL